MSARNGYTTITYPDKNNQYNQHNQIGGTPGDLVINLDNTDDLDVITNVLNLINKSTYSIYMTLSALDVAKKNLEAMKIGKNQGNINNAAAHWNTVAGVAKDKLKKLRDREPNIGLTDNVVDSYIDSRYAVSNVVGNVVGNAPYTTTIKKEFAKIGLSSITENTYTNNEYAVILNVPSKLNKIINAFQIISEHPNLLEHKKQNAEDKKTTKPELGAKGPKPAGNQHQEAQRGPPRPGNDTSVRGRGRGLPGNQHQEAQGGPPGHDPSHRKGAFVHGAKLPGDGPPARSALYEGGGDYSVFDRLEDIDLTDLEDIDYSSLDNLDDIELDFNDI